MRDIEKVTLELTPYEAALVRHALIDLSKSMRINPICAHSNNLKAIINIDNALARIGIIHLTKEEIEKGRIIHD